MNKKVIIFDFNRTLYDPDKRDLIEGAIDVLEKFSKKDMEMILISRKEGNRLDIINKFGLDIYFREIEIVENKNEDMFKKISKKYSTWDKYVVGDYMHEEIRYGNLVGMKTIWIKAGKFKNMKPRDKYDKPNHTVRHISEIISKIIN